jgi:Zinc finger C-x8-C-x5-C-x3-H type (and similar)
MPSRTTPENTLSKSESPGFPSDRSTQPNNKRWRFNGTGQLVDSGAANEWDLADEIVRLSIADVGADPGEDLRGTLHTPPQSKMAAAAVAQLSEASPLESSSDASADSPQTSDHQISISHSRGSSIDTTISSSQESAISTASHTLLAPSQVSLKVNAAAEVKERPHSFSGGISASDLRRLQLAGEAPVTGMPGDAADYQGQVHQQWPSSHYRENNGSNERQFTPESQLTYPSLAHHSTAMPRPQPQQQQFDYRSGPVGPSVVPPPQRDELPIDYHMQQRNFNPLTGLAAPASSAPPAFVAGRPTNNVAGLSYRQPQRSFPQQGLVPSPTTLGYTGGHHTSHLSLGNTQQIYDMMLPGPHENHHPAVARVQQQHNVFPRTHQHSASDPSALRDAATLALLNNNMQGFGPPGPAMFPSAMPPPPMSLYASQFYPAQDPYSRTDVASAQAMAARLQSQYTGPYGVPGQAIGIDAVPRSGMSPDPSSPTGNGPSANNRKLGLYKTELCRSWEEKGSCRYASKCQFAHGEDELRKVARHPKACDSQPLQFTAN